MRGIAFVVAVGMQLGLVAQARGAEPAADPDRALYLKYCSACHGPEGKGDGVASSFLRPPPTDLTQLARSHGGRFPFDEVVRTIDGTSGPRAHGDSEMPVWGEVLRDEPGATGTRREVLGKITRIAQHLRSIQAK